MNNVFNCLKRLRNVLIVLFVGLLFCMCNEQKRLASTDIMMKQVPFVKAMVGDKHVWMLIDTGSSVSLLDKTFSESAHFDAHKVAGHTIVHAAGIDKYDSITNQQVIIKNTVADMDFYVIDLSPLFDKLSQTLDKKVVGILGCDYLAATGALIDVQNKQLLLVSVFNKLNTR